MYPLSPGMLSSKNQCYPVAISGRCPHLHFPLGEGRLVGDNLQCGDHGMTFAPDGACAIVQSHRALPSMCNILAYPVAKRWEWIWMGDPAFCDEALIPDQQAMDLGDPDRDRNQK